MCLFYLGHLPKQCIEGGPRLQPIHCMFKVTDLGMHTQWEPRACYFKIAKMIDGCEEFSPMVSLHLYSTTSLPFLSL